MPRIGSTPNLSPILENPFVQAKNAISRTIYVHSLKVDENSTYQTTKKPSRSDRLPKTQFAGVSCQFQRLVYRVFCNVQILVSAQTLSQLPICSTKWPSFLRLLITKHKPTGTEGMFHPQHLSHQKKTPAYFPLNWLVK